MSEDNQNSTDNQNSSMATYLTAGAGVIFILISVLLIILYPNPSPAQYQVFKIVLALACAGFAAAIPGAINVGVGHAVRAGGAMGVFVIIYFFSPAGMMLNRPTNEEHPKDGVTAASPTPGVSPNDHAKATEPALKNLQTPFNVEVIYDQPGGLNMRKSPGSGAVIVKLLKGSKLTVQNRFVESNNYRWWPVKLDQGWIAEGETDLTKPRLLKAISVPAIANNEQVVVNYSSSRNPGLSLRRDYDLRSETIAVLSQGSKMTVIGGPQTKQGYIWWLVRVDDGWITEGPTDDAQPRWLKPASR
ncbi:MAG TPA: SH3 domain-containing protein [Pyrinomonadaceae bacterium]|jgi:hypothetical protein|nr:SH3 domain-containing protein [Pyrinomonadaceae bacterium]